MSAKRDLIPLYGGVLKGNRVGTITRAGVDFDIIHPGYDSQGRRRQSWTQFVVDGIPVYEVKRLVTLARAQDIFDEMWSKYIKKDEYLVKPGIAAAKKERIKKFRDNQTGEVPAPSYGGDRRPEGKKYTA